MAIGEQIKSFRESIGMTQLELAHLSGVAQSQLSRIESGKSTDPTWRTVAKLADALELSIVDLVCEELERQK